MLREETELCPHCMGENVIQHDVEKDGYEVTCVHCGKLIMLCDACIHSADNPTNRCDWCENDGCFRKRSTSCAQVNETKFSQCEENKASLLRGDREFEKILQTEYSSQFDEIRKKAMIVSYYKYGAVSENYDKFKCIDALSNIQKRIQKYKETGNTEFLADVANFAMIEFMYPSIKGARYTPTGDGACELDGFGINEIRNFE